MAETFGNAAITTLSGPVDASTNPVTLSVATFTNFPSSGQYRVLIDQEIFLVTAGAGTTSWTATRALEGPGMASHTSGTSVYQIVTAAALAEFAQTPFTNTFTAAPQTINPTGGYTGDLLELQVGGSNKLIVDQAGNLAGGGASIGASAGINYPTNWNLSATGTAVVNLATALVKSNVGHQFLKDIQRSKQSIVFASTITPDATAGEIIAVGALTGNMTINAPTNPATGQHLTFLFTQDGTGSRTLTWNAVFKTAFQPTPTASSISSVTFFYDGTNWQQLGAIQIDGSGNVVVQGTLKSTGLLTAAAGATVTTGDATITAGNLVLGAAASRIVPGATSLSLRNNANSADNVLVTDAGATTIRGALTASKDLKRSSQSIAFSATITPDATAGELVIVGALTGNMTINAPTNPATGQCLTFLFTQDATGGRTITWNAAFKTAFQPSISASAISSVTFFYDGTNWQQRFGVPVDNSGVVDSVARVAIRGGNTLRLYNSTNGSWAEYSFDGSKVSLTWPFATATSQYLQAGGDFRRTKQAPAFAASYTPDPSAGGIVTMTLTGNITVNAVASPVAGQELILIFTQDGTGGRTITYNAAYKTTGGAAITTTASTTNTDHFVYDGTNWRLKSRITGN